MRSALAVAPQPPTSIPLAPVRLVRDRHGLLYRRARSCPYCGRRHRHGGASEVPPPGVRYAHRGASGSPGRTM